MPGLPLVARETTFSRSRTVDQMCRQNFFNSLSPEEALAAEESLSVYCKPVELYNILLRRASYNPLFLQRCLSYKIQARHYHRIQITVSVYANMDNELPPPSLSPLYIFLARPVTESSQTEGTAVYRLCRVCKLDTFNQAEASFVVPEFSKLFDDFRCRSLTLILLGHGEESCEQATTADGNDDGSCPQKLVGNYIWGKLLLDSILSSSDMHMNLKLGQRIEVPSTIIMHPCTLEPTFLDVNNLIYFQTPHTSGTENTANQAKLSISAREVGSSERSPYESCLYDDVPANVIRLRAGNVIFNYKYYNNSLQKTEVTEDFSCPFCLVKCASFKGLRYHLTSSHDLFNFEFWVTEEYQAVNVSMKTDIWRSEILADGIDPRTQTFSYRSRKIRRRRAKISGPSARNVHPLPLGSDLPEVPGYSSRADPIGEVRGISNVMPLNTFNNKKISLFLLKY